MWYLYFAMNEREIKKNFQRIYHEQNKKILRVIILFFLTGFCLTRGHGIFLIQETQKTEIKISTVVSQIEIPLNRTFELKVTLSWIGDSAKYTVVNFENPILTNFDIVGTSATNRSELVNNQIHIFKDSIYTLQPKELGMGYVEGVIVKVHDNIVDKDETLSTQRIPVEVVDPVPEKGEEGIGWLFILIPFMVLILGSSFFFWFRRRRRYQKKSVEEPILPIESHFLEELRGQLDLNHPDLQGDFSTLSKLLRRYLEEKFSLRALELTTDKLLDSLGETPLEQHQIDSVKEILARSDEIKFSGIQGTQEELTRFYTLIEGILENLLHISKEEINKES